MNFPLNKFLTDKGLSLSEAQSISAIAGEIAKQELNELNNIEIRSLTRELNSKIYPIVDSNFESFEAIHENVAHIGHLNGIVAYLREVINAFCAEIDDSD